jgi:hypothetical protein
LVVNSKKNVEIVVQSGIKQRIANQKRTKAVVIIAEITTIFRNMCVITLLLDQWNNNCNKARKL